MSKNNPKNRMQSQKVKEIDGKPVKPIRYIYWLNNKKINYIAAAYKDGSFVKSDNEHPKRYAEV